MFIDEAIITVKGGDGGRGCVSWRREKYVPKGGPDGGNGGQGGSVIFIADANTDTLSDYASSKKFSAETGDYGQGQNKAGHNGKDLILRVPPGTVLLDLGGGEATPTLLADLPEDGDQVVVVHGGRGGYGNAHFASSVRQRPDFAELGEPAEVKVLKLELKLVADAGIIGYPNAGKSTLISVISAARPKIADYAFTTIVPNLGVVNVHDRAFVVCDIPGLIEGASEGKGLGHQFLKHIERCGVLVHLLDCSRTLLEGSHNPDALVNDYRAIRTELAAYSPTLNEKKELTMLSKIDLLQPEQLDDVRKSLKKAKIPLFGEISAATKLGIQDFLEKLLPIVLEERQKRLALEVEERVVPEELPVIRPHLDSHRMGTYRIEREGEAVVIRGKRIEQFAKMTNFESQGAMRRFYDVIDRVGISKTIKKMQLPPGTPVSIGPVRIEQYLEQE